MSDLAPSHSGGILRPDSPFLPTTDDTISTPSGTGSHQNSDSEGCTELPKAKSRSKYFTSPKISFSLFSSNSKIKEQPEKNLGSPSEASEHTTASPGFEINTSVSRIVSWTASPSVVTWYVRKPGQYADAVCKNMSYEESRVTGEGSLLSSPTSEISSSSAAVLNKNVLQTLHTSNPSFDATYSEMQNEKPEQVRSDSSQPAQKSSFFSSVLKKISSAVKSSKPNSIELLRAQAAEAFQVLEITKRKFEEAEQRATEAESRHTADLMSAVDCLAKAEEAARNKWSWIGIGASGAKQDIPSLKARVVEAKRNLEDLREAATAELDAMRRQVVDAQSIYDNFAQDPRLTSIQTSQATEGTFAGVRQTDLDVELESSASSNVSGDLRSTSSSSAMSKYLSTPKLSFSFFKSKKDRPSAPASEQSSVVTSINVAHSSFTAMPSVVTWMLPNGSPVCRVLEFPSADVDKESGHCAQPAPGSRGTSPLGFDRAQPSIAPATTSPPLPSAEASSQPASSSKGSLISFNFFTRRSGSSKETSTLKARLAPPPNFRSLPSVVTWCPLPLAGQVPVPDSAPTVRTADSATAAKQSSVITRSTSGKSSYFFAPKLSFFFPSTKKGAPAAATVEPWAGNRYRQLPSVVTWYQCPSTVLVAQVSKQESAGAPAVFDKDSRVAVGALASGGADVAVPSGAQWRALPSVVTWNIGPRRAVLVGAAAAAVPAPSVVPSAAPSGVGFLSGLFSKLSSTASPARRSSTKTLAVCVSAPASLPDKSARPSHYSGALSSSPPTNMLMEDNLTSEYRLMSSALPLAEMHACILPTYTLSASNASKYALLVSFFSFSSAFGASWPDGLFIPCASAGRDFGGRGRGTRRRCHRRGRRAER